MSVLWKKKRHKLMRYILSEPQTKNNYGLKRIQFNEVKIEL